MADHAKRNKPYRDALLERMSDLQWHPHWELKAVAGIRYSARLLELRRLGYTVEDRPVKGQGKEYRLLSLEKRKPREKRVKIYMSKTDAETLRNDGRLTRTARIDLNTALHSYYLNEDKL